MTLHIKIIGTILIFLSLIHLVFPRYFKWKEELAKLSLVNRQILKVHTFFIALMLLLMGMLNLAHPLELQELTLGRSISLGLGVFWSARFIIQFTGYSSQLWKGKTFETIIHIVFSINWAYFSFIYLNIYFHWL